MSLRRTSLYAEHEALGAKLVDFGGWEMPLSYHDGTIAEHLACREDSAVFDVSHLGTVRVEGPDAFALLQTNLTNDLHRIEPGRAQYQHLLDDADASVLDDLIVWWVGEESFDVMPNASNTERVIAVLGGRDVTERAGGHRRAGTALERATGDDRPRRCRDRAFRGGQFRIRRC